MVYILKIFKDIASDHQVLQILEDAKGGGQRQVQTLHEAYANIFQCVFHTWQNARHRFVSNRKVVARLLRRRHDLREKYWRQNYFKENVQKCYIHIPTSIILLLGSKTEPFNDYPLNRIPKLRHVLLSIYLSYIWKCVISS